MQRIDKLLPTLPETSEIDSKKKLKPFKSISLFAYSSANGITFSSMWSQPQVQSAVMPLVLDGPRAKI
ncbi:MAG: hypothetical protein ABI597_08535 [Gammaproteobacteria bacterium]